MAVLVSKGSHTLAHPYFKMNEHASVPKMQFRTAIVLINACVSLQKSAEEMMECSMRYVQITFFFFLHSSRFVRLLSRALLHRHEAI